MYFENVKQDILSYDVDMRVHTTFKIGGRADCFALPTTAEELIALIAECHDRSYPYVLLGGGSNVLVLDGGIKGLVISTKKLNSLSHSGCTITADCGTPLHKIVNLACENSLAGIETLCGIPGTIGGAVCMNAGAFGQEIGDVVKSVTVFDGSQIRKLSRRECGFGYRTSAIMESGFVVISAILQLSRSDKNGIMVRAQCAKEQRDILQPKGFSSAGSVFKRLKTLSAGQLIEKCGFKGVKIGGAEVSTRHANFIINNGNATAQDVLELIKNIQQKVLKDYGENLEPEIKIIGEK